MGSHVVCERGALFGPYWAEIQSRRIMGDGNLLPDFLPPGVFQGVKQVVIVLMVIDGNGAKNLGKIWDTHLSV